MGGDAGSMARGNAGDLHGVMLQGKEVMLEVGRMKCRKVEEGIAGEGSLEGYQGVLFTVVRKIAFFALVAANFQSYFTQEKCRWGWGGHSGRPGRKTNRLPKDVACGHKVRTWCKRLKMLMASHVTQKPHHDPWEMMCCMPAPGGGMVLVGK